MKKKIQNSTHRYFLPSHPEKIKSCVLEQLSDIVANYANLLNCTLHHCRITQHHQVAAMSVHANFFRSLLLLPINIYCKRLSNKKNTSEKKKVSTTFYMFIQHCCSVHNSNVHVRCGGVWGKTFSRSSLAFSSES